MSNQQQQLKECNKCKAAGFPNQLIGFLKDGVYPDSGKVKWKLLNPDTSQHEHKKPSVVGTTIGPIQAAQYGSTITGGAANSNPSVNMSESQRKSVDDSPPIQQQQFDKEEYFRLKEEKYDKNIQDYKNWQTAMLKEFENQSRTLEDLLLSFQGMAKDIKDMLRILSTQTQEPTIQKASELAYGLRVEGKKSSQAEQEKAFENLDNTIDELAVKIEKEIKQEQEQEQEQQQEEQGYPE